MIHSGSMRECVEDELCGWCLRPRAQTVIADEALGEATAPQDGRSSGVCVSRWTPFWPESEGGGGAPSPVCAGPLHVIAASVPDWWVQQKKDVGPSLRGLQPDGALVPASIGDCALVVTRSAPAVFTLEGNSKMAYHFFKVRLRICIPYTFL